MAAKDVESVVRFSAVPAVGTAPGATLRFRLVGGSLAPSSYNTWYQAMANGSSYELDLDVSGLEPGIFFLEVGVRRSRWGCGSWTGTPGRPSACPSCCAYSCRPVLFLPHAGDRRLRPSCQHAHNPGGHRADLPEGPPARILGALRLQPGPGVPTYPAHLRPRSAPDCPAISRPFARSCNLIF